MRARFFGTGIVSQTLLAIIVTGQVAWGLFAPRFLLGVEFLGVAMLGLVRRGISVSRAGLIVGTVAEIVLLVATGLCCVAAARGKERSASLVVVGWILVCFSGPVCL